MLRTAKELQDFEIVASDVATDAAIGDVKDLCVDDEAWTIRYLVVETGSWLFSRKVPISPISAGMPDGTSKLLPVSLTREQVKDSPDVDTDRPVTRQHEKVAPQRIQRVSWAEQSVAVDLTREALKQAPGYDPALPLPREMEIAVYKHYGRAAYWPDAETGSDPSALSAAA